MALADAIVVLFDHHYLEQPLDYLLSINDLENRVNEVLLGKKNELLWILEHNTVYTGGTSSNQKDLINRNIKTIVNTG